MSKALDIAALRAEFPILAREVNGRPLVYLDNAASAQKPRAVIDAMTKAMEEATPMFIAGFIRSPMRRRRHSRRRVNRRRNF